MRVQRRFHTAQKFRRFEQPRAYYVRTSRISLFPSKTLVPSLSFPIPANSGVGSILTPFGPYLDLDNKMRRISSGSNSGNSSQSHLTRNRSQSNRRLTELGMAPPPPRKRRKISYAQGSRAIEENYVLRIR